MVPGCYDCFYNIGFNHSQKKEYDQAEAAFMKAIELKANYVEAYNGLATVYNAQKKFDKAAEASAKAIELAGAAGPGGAGGSGGVDAEYNQGVILWNAGKIAEAAEHFQKVIFMKPDHADAHYQLGMAYVNQNKMAEAVPMFEKYLELAPDRPVRGDGEGHPVQHQEVGTAWRIPSRRDEIAASLSAVRQRLARALERAGRSPSSVRLMAISKTRPAEDVRAAFEAGQAEFGENRVQEALEKIAATSDIPITWHLVGHLQSNKARRASGAFGWIHSIDSVDLLKRVDAAAEEAGRRPELLVQVDLAGEPTKHGAQAETWLALFEAASACRAARVAGLMLLAAVHAGPRRRQAVFPAAPGVAG